MLNIDAPVIWKYLFLKYCGLVWGGGKYKMCVSTPLNLFIKSYIYLIVCIFFVSNWYTFVWKKCCLYYTHLTT